MKVFLYYFLVLSFVLFSCTETAIEESLISQQNGSATDNDSELRSHPNDGKYDVLGWGCDVAVDMFIGKKPVINNDYLIAAFGEGEYDGGLVRGNGDMAEYEVIAGSNAVDYMKAYSQNMKIEVEVKAFGVTAKSTLSKFTRDSTVYDSKYSYASYEEYVQKGNFKYAPKINVLRRYVTDEFKKEVDNDFDAQSIVDRYGTHVYSDVKTGGKLRITYRSQITGEFSLSESKKSIAAEVGVKGVAEAVTGTSVDISTEVTDQEKSTIKRDSKEAKYVLTLTGGLSNIPIVEMILNADNTPTINTGEWTRSVQGTNTALIGFDPGSLIPIWEFVEDPVKKEQLKLAVVRHFEKHNFKLVETVELDMVPVYRYYNPTHGQHYYTVWMRDLKDYYYANLEFYALSSSKVEPNAVPIYRYYHRGTGNHYYSSILRELNGYTCENIEFYAPLIKLPNTRPVYRYYNSRRGLHYYSTWNRPVNEFDLQGIEFYAY